MIFNNFYILKNRNPKPILYGAILVSFIIIAVFGSLIISYHLGGNCLSSILNSDNCPGTGLAEIEHHLSLPHIFSQVTPAGLSVLSILLSILGIAGLFVVFRKSIIEFPNSLSFARKKDDTSFSHLSPTITRWLSLLENSPSLS